MLTNNQTDTNGVSIETEEVKTGGDVVHVRFQQPEPIEPEDSAKYLAEMLADMRVIAAKSGFKFLAALIEVASEEARLQIGKKRQYADIA